MKAIAANPHNSPRGDDEAHSGWLGDEVGAEWKDLREGTKNIYSEDNKKENENYLYI